MKMGSVVSLLNGFTGSVAKQGKQLMGTTLSADDEPVATNGISRSDNATVASWLYSTCLVAKTPPSAGASLRHLCKQSTIPEVDDPLLGGRLHPKRLYRSLNNAPFS